MSEFSILDLAFVPEGFEPTDALHRSLNLAQHAEQWGYRRFGSLNIIIWSVLRARRQRSLSAT